MIPFEAYIVHENPLWDLGKEAENPSLDYKMRGWFSQRNTPQDSQDNLLMHGKLIVNNIHDKLHDYFQLPFTGNWAGYTLEIVKNAKGKMMKGSERSNSVYILEQFWISLVIWATELDTSLSSSICQPASICRYRARGLSLFRGDKVKTVIELDYLSSSVTYRARWLIELGFCSARM